MGKYTYQRLLERIQVLSLSEKELENLVTSDITILCEKLSDPAQIIRNTVHEVATDKRYRADLLAAALNMGAASLEKYLSGRMAERFRSENGSVNGGGTLVGELKELIAALWRSGKTTST
jgi:hypothetical protein